MSDPLPSQVPARLLMQGEWLALPSVLATMLGRGAIIGAGAALFGVPMKYVIPAAVGGAVAVEIMVLVHEAKASQTATP